MQSILDPSDFWEERTFRYLELSREVPHRKICLLVTNVKNNRDDAEKRAEVRARDRDLLGMEEEVGRREEHQADRRQDSAVLGKPKKGENSWQRGY